MISDVSNTVKREEEKTLEGEACDMEIMWQQIEANNNAIKAVQESVMKLLEISEETKKKHNLISDVSNTAKRCELLELEKKYDNKLAIFMEAYSKEMTEKIQSICKTFDMKLANMKQAITNFKISTQKQINELYTICPTSDIGRLQKLENDFIEFRHNIQIIQPDPHPVHHSVTQPVHDSPTTDTEAEDPSSTPAQPQLPNFNDTGHLNQEISEGENAGNSEHGGVGRNEEDLELLVLMDSNNAFVKWDWFWTFTKGTKKTTFNGSLYEIEDIIREDRSNRKIQYVVLSIGVNDVDVKSAEEVFEQLQVVIDLIRSKYGETKIVIGELTPRKDERDEQVKRCNELIKTLTDEHNYLFLAKQQRLRTSDWRHYRDDKHITKFAAPLFVSSLKNALRDAYGIPRRTPENHNRFDNRGPSSTRERYTGRGR